MKDEGDYHICCDICCPFYFNRGLLNDRKGRKGEILAIGMVIYMIIYIYCYYRLENCINKRNGPKFIRLLASFCFLFPLVVDVKF